MIILLTPSKTMDFETPVPDFVTATQPVFEQESVLLRSLLAEYDEAQIRQLMHVSASLAQQVRMMYEDTTSHKSALWAYAGDVFKGFGAASLSLEAANFAEQHVLIPSAVYGLLRPFDVIGPYRLEMKAKVAPDGTKDLYDFWSGRLARYLSERAQQDRTICVLSSAEYARAATLALSPDVRLVTPVFMDQKSGGGVGSVPIYSKMMRGVMARWIIDHEIDTPEDMLRFQAQGYRYNEAMSSPDTPVFYRQVPKPLRFLQ